MEDRVSIHFSVEDGIIEVEQKKGPLISRKEISRDQLLSGKTHRPSCLPGFCH